MKTTRELLIERMGNDINIFSPKGVNIMVEIIEEIAERQVKTCNKPAVIKSCENCKFDAECRHKQVMPLGYHYCKFYIEHVL